MALKLIEELTKPFKPKEYSDAYTDEIKAIIKKKAKGQRVTVKKEPTAKSAKTQDILSLLKSSLEGRKKTTKRRKAA